MEPLTVVCVLRSGGLYGPRHVDGLRAQVQHWMPAARFVCLSDMPVRCDRVALQSDWPGWWAKIELFRHFTGRSLFLDLDTVLLGDPTPLVTGQFLMIRNWKAPQLRASGVMSWQGDYGHITRAFAPIADRVMPSYRTSRQWGDQAFIAERAGPVAVFPAGAIVSYRYQLAPRGHTHVPPPPPARIVAFNGTHLPWAEGAPEWARKWWNA